MFFNVNAARKTDASKNKSQFSFFGMPTAGIRVSEENALKYSAVWACTKIISETIACLPWHVMSSGSKTGIAEHSLDDILYRRPNPEISSNSFKELVSSHAVTWGNHYSEIERNRLGNVSALWPIDPSRVETDRDSKGKLVYVVQNDQGANTELRPSDVYHVRGPSRDGINGYSVIQYAKESISLGLASESFGSSFFGNGAIPGLVIKNTSNADMGEDGVANLLKTWNKKHQGAKNAGRAEYLDAGLEIQTLGIPPNDAQFLETRKFQITEIARWFRMPPHKLADLERSTHNNIESQNIEFVTDSIMPWVNRMESQANFSLFKSSEAGQYYTKLNLMGLLRGDSKARAEFYKTMSSLGVFDIDEIRDKEDLDPLGGDIGALRIVPMNMTTVEKMASGENIKAASNVVAEYAARFTKIEIKKAEKTESAFDMREFYVGHARNMADAFRAASLLIYKGDNIDALLIGFFGNYVANSADQLQNSIEQDKKTDLLRSWNARKADNLTRDLIKELVKK